MEINELLAERGKTHWDFTMMLRLLRTKEVWPSSLPIRSFSSSAPALEMIATKIGRILAGNPDHRILDDIAAMRSWGSERYEIRQHDRLRDFALPFEKWEVYRIRFDFL